MDRVTQLIFTLVTVTCLLCVLCFDVAAQVRRPNIVVIVADDMGYADVGIHGSNDIPTQHRRVSRSWNSFHECLREWPVLQPNSSGVDDGTLSTTV